MANRYFHKVKAFDVEHVVIAFSFFPRGEGPPEGPSDDGYRSDGYGMGYVLHNDGSGTFRIVLDDSFPRVLSGHLDLVLRSSRTAAVMADWVRPFPEVDGKTLTLRIHDNSNNWVQLEHDEKVLVALHLQNSIVGTGL